MREFTVGGRNYCQSFALDACRRAGVTVTVGVEATREQEAELLNDCCETQSSDYTPFNQKYGPDDSMEVPVETLVERFRGRIGVAVQRGSPGGLPRAEAANSAVLYAKMQIGTSTVVVTDGSEYRAELLWRALKSYEEEPSPVVACQKSEFYYPQSYLADLIASRVAEERVDFLRRVQDSIETVELTGEHGRFDKFYGVIAGERFEYEPPNYDTLHAQRQSTRVRAWFDGKFGQSGGGQPQTSSTRPSRNWLRSEGYDAVADRLS